MMIDYWDHPHLPLLSVSSDHATFLSAGRVVFHNEALSDDLVISHGKKYFSPVLTVQKPLSPQRTLSLSRADTSLSSSPADVSSHLFINGEFYPFTCYRSGSHYYCDSTDTLEYNNDMQCFCHAHLDFPEHADTYSAYITCTCFVPASNLVGYIFDTETLDCAPTKTLDNRIVYTCTFRGTSKTHDLSFACNDLRSEPHLDLRRCTATKDTLSFVAVVDPKEILDNYGTDDPYDYIYSTLAINLATDSDLAEYISDDLKIPKDDITARYDRVSDLDIVANTEIHLAANAPISQLPQTMSTIRQLFW